MQIGYSVLTRLARGRTATCALLAMAGAFTTAQAVAQDKQPTLGELLQMANEAALDADRLAKRARQAADDAQAAANRAADAATRAAAAAGATALGSTSAGESTSGSGVPGAPVRMGLAEAQPVAPNALAKTSTVKSVGLNTQAQLTANKDGGNATIKLAQPDDARRHGTLYEVTLSSPLSKVSDTTQLATLDGLATAASLGYTYGRYQSLAGDDFDRIATSPWTVYGGSGKVGYQNYNFYDATSLAKGSASRTPFAIGAFGGMTTPGDANFLVLAKFEYQRAYKDADAKVLCPAFTVGTTTCVSGAIGHPGRTIKRIVSLEGRYTGSRFEISPSVSFDAASRVKAIDVPIYFLGTFSATGSPTPFNAGIDVAWRSDTRRSVVGLFVGAPFSFWSPAR